MSTAKKRHYVPQEYINAFSFNNHGDVFVFNKNFPLSTIKTKNKASICYSEDPKFYRIIIQQILFPDEPYDLEDSFYYEKNSIMKNIIDKANHQLLNSETDISELIKIILNFKSRNLSHYDFINQEITKNIVFENTLNKIINNTNEFISVGAKKFNISEEKIIQIILSNKDRFRQLLDNKIFTSNIVASNLSRQLSGSSDNYKEGLNFLLEKKIEIYYSNNDPVFISSDNPGFSIGPNYQISNKPFLGNSILFIFPISPYAAIMFNLTKKIDGTLKVIYKKADKKFINLMNNSTLISSTKLVYSKTRAS